MKYSAAVLASLTALVAAQYPQQAPYPQQQGAYPPQGYPQQQGPYPPQAQGPAPGSQQPCGFSCIITPMKSSTCRPAAPPGYQQQQPPAGQPPAGFAPQGRYINQWGDDDEGPQGPPQQGPPPRASPQEIAATRDCFCKVPNLQAAFNGCVPQACQQTRGNPNQLVQAFNQMCAQTPGYVAVKGF